MIDITTVEDAANADGVPVSKEAMAVAVIANPEPSLKKVCIIQETMNAVNAMYKPSRTPMKTMLRAHEMMQIYVHMPGMDVEAALHANNMMLQSINLSQKIMNEWRTNANREPAVTASGREYQKIIYDDSCPLNEEQRKKLGKTTHDARQLHNFLCGLDHLLHASGKAIKNTKTEHFDTIEFQNPGWCKTRLEFMIKEQANLKRGRKPVGAKKQRKRKGAAAEIDEAQIDEPQLDSLFHSRYLLAAIARQNNASASQPRSRSVGGPSRAARPSQTRTDARPGWMNNLGM